MEDGAGLALTADLTKFNAGRPAKVITAVGEGNTEQPSHELSPAPPERGTNLVTLTPLLILGVHLAVCACLLSKFASRSNIISP